MSRLVCILVFIFSFHISFSQSSRWQQKISYDINVSLTVANNRLKGIEKIVYENNSPDTLKRVFFHTYWNAFQPNSSMDVRSRELGKIVLSRTAKGDVQDWDPRVKDRIQNLTPDEIGYQNVAFVKVAGRVQQLKLHETILEVNLDKPILPNSKTNFEVSFEAQVPLQVRRSGRDSKEGVRYSISQWYPKMVEYDYQGWNANPYIAREFYGVWGDYNVTINIDRSYMVAGTGTLQNASEVGFGYATKTATADNNSNLTWNFKASNVHDFVWAADPEYKMIKRQAANGPLLYFVYKEAGAANDSSWQKVADTAQMCYPIIERTFGAYPYKNYSFIQGGDGGMEYAMATLIKSASVGTALHEWMHSWYQGLLGSNESLYPWMDEGFTTYAAERVLTEVRNAPGFAQQKSYNSYFNLVRSGFAEPMSTHADHYSTNYAYSQNAYSKGAVFLSQLGYITGDAVRDTILMKYYNEWRFKHPNPNDFIRVAEKVSGMDLDWYKEYWINSTKTIDFAIDSLWQQEGKTNIRIKRIGEMPMPLEVQLTYKDGSTELHYAPLDMMYNIKPVEDATQKWFVHEEWRWAAPTYTFTVDHNIFDLKEVQIDPSRRLADIDLRNNVLKLQW